VNVGIHLLGRFEVRLAGQAVPASAWSRRQAATLVKVLALAPRRQLHREQVMDVLWPDVPVEEATPRLHKAAHFARRTLGPDSVVLRNETVMLFPDAPVGVDVLRFEELAGEALAGGGAEAAEKAAAAYAGPLLPEDRYEAWAQDTRSRLELLHRQLLRQAGRWAELAEADPTDEEAVLAVMREHAARGDRRAALRLFERLDRALHRELGVGPSDEALALRDSLLAGMAEPASAMGGRGAVAAPGPARDDNELVGRAAELARFERIRAEVYGGRGRTVFVSGAPGVGKSALVDAVRREAAGRGWRTGHGIAAAVEGAWPYAPAVEALADMCRRHPTLLDGLDDRYRAEIDRALAGRDLGWSGDGAHQRLFLAVAELARLAAAGKGAMLVVDDAHEADDASLRLLHYLARNCVGERLMLVLVHRRQPVTDAFEQVRASLMGRLGAVELPVAPLDRQDSAALTARHHPQLPPDAVDQVWEVSGGLPFGVVELARSMQQGSAPLRRPGAVPLGTLSPTIRTVLEHVAVTGTTFDTDEFLALSGLPEGKAFDCLDAALAAMVIDRTLAGYQFRHPLIREALLDDVPPHRQRQLHRACAERLIALEASPARIGHHLLMAGATAAAVPYVLRAAETEAAIGAYRDALTLVDSVLPHATGPEGARLYALRADLLAATADPAAVQAYREAIGFADERGRRMLLARMARIAAYSGDLPTAEAALDGLEPDGGPADATILLVRGNLAYFRGDLDTAWQATANARRIMVGSRDDWQVLDLLTLQGLIAHHRGDYLQRIRQDLQRTRNDPRMATAVFDSQLCVAEYLLYGTTPYPEVISFAEELRATAQRAGALRAVAFATALVGEAALLAGDLDLAERELRDAVDLHREIAAPAGEAHSLQRLAETYLARGDRPSANRLLQRALPLARWSAVAPHLLQRVYGTMIMAAADPEEARAVVDRTQALRGHTDRCTFCDVMFAVPAAIACADIGDVDEAIRYLAEAEVSAARWEYTAWQAAILEARAHLARAQGDVAAWAPLMLEATHIFEEAGQPLDAARCRATAADHQPEWQQAGGR